MPNGTHHPHRDGASNLINDSITVDDDAVRVIVNRGEQHRDLWPLRRCGERACGSEREHQRHSDTVERWHQRNGAWPAIVADGQQIPEGSLGQRIGEILRCDLHAHGSAA